MYKENKVTGEKKKKLNMNFFLCSQCMYTHTFHGRQCYQETERGLKLLYFLTDQNSKHYK